MARSPSSCAMPTNVLETDLVIEKTFCVVSGVRAPEVPLAGDLPVADDDQAVRLAGFGGRRDLLQRRGVEPDARGCDRLPLRAGNRRGGRCRRSRSCRRARARRGVVVTGARGRPDERDDQRDERELRPTATRTGDDDATLTGRPGNRAVTRKLTGSRRIAATVSTLALVPTTDTHRAVAHLARRAGFGLAADAVDALAADGYEAAVERVCADLRRSRRRGRSDRTTGVRPCGVPRRSPERRCGDAPGRRDPCARRAARARAVVVAAHGRGRAAGAGEAHVPLARPLRDEHGEGQAGRAHARAVPDVVRRRGRTVRRARQCGCARPGDARVARRAGEHERSSERELRARAVRAVHARPRHARPRGHGGAAVHRGRRREAARALTGWTIRSDLHGRARAQAARRAGPRPCSGSTGALGLTEVVAAATSDAAVRTARGRPLVEPHRPSGHRGRRGGAGVGRTVRP